MREIKFRIWSARDDKYFYNDLDDIILNSGDFAYAFLNNEEDIIEQFTGLLDSKGREIYEGDILNHYACGKGIIHFEADHGGFRYGDVDLNCDWACEAEVIGNIHESE